MCTFIYIYIYVYIYIYPPTLSACGNLFIPSFPLFRTDLYLPFQSNAWCHIWVRFFLLGSEKKIDPRGGRGGWGGFRDPPKDLQSWPETLRFFRRHRLAAFRRPNVFFRRLEDASRSLRDASRTPPRRINFDPKSNAYASIVSTTLSHRAVTIFYYIQHSLQVQTYAKNNGFYRVP